MSPTDGFWIYTDLDSDGNPLVAAGEERHFREARPGDHLFCPFQCELVLPFTSSKGRTPGRDEHADEFAPEVLATSEPRCVLVQTTGNHFGLLAHREGTT